MPPSILTLVSGRVASGLSFAGIYVRGKPFGPKTAGFLTLSIGLSTVSGA